jgi:hypothetical protein
MQAVTRKRITAVDLRARVPAIARALALILLVGGAVFVGVSYYKMRNNTISFESESPALSKIIGITNGCEQRITKNDRLYLWLRASVMCLRRRSSRARANQPGLSPTGDKPDQIFESNRLGSKKAPQCNGNVD